MLLQAAGMNQPLPPPPPEPLYVLRGHRAAVQCAAFFPDCSVLAAGDAEGELKLWDLDSRRVTASVRAHETHAGILQVACPKSSSTGQPLVISQGRDSVVKCWQLHSGSTLSSVPVHTLSAGSYNFCRFALLEPGQTSSSCTVPDASLAAPLPPRATADSDESAGLQVVQGFQPAVYADAAAAAADAQQLGSTGEQQNHSKQGLLSQQLQGQLATIIPCTQLPNAEAAEAAEAQPAVDTSNIGCTDLTEDLEELLVLGQQRHSAAASPSANADSTAGAVATSAGATPDHGSQESSTSSGYCWLALPAADAADVGMWQLGQFSSGSSSSSASGNPSTLPSIMLRQERTKERPSNGLCMAIALLRPQGSALHAVTGYEDGTVALWDTRNPTKYLASICSHSESIMCLAVAANCRLGFSGSADESLAAFDLSIPKGKITSAQKLALAGKPGISDVAIRPDGRIAASAGWDGKIRVWHARKRQPLAVLRWHSQQVASVSFSSDSRLLAAGGRDNNISLWSLYPPDA